MAHKTALWSYSSRPCHPTMVGGRLDCHKNVTMIMLPRSSISLKAFVYQGFRVGGSLGGGGWRERGSRSCATLL